MPKIKLICGSSTEDGTNMFWVADTSCSRFFVIPQSTRVDVLGNMLSDFIGDDLINSEVYVVSEPLITKRGKDMAEYLIKASKQGE